VKNINLSNVVVPVEALLREAGKLIMDAFHTRAFKVHEKVHEGLVTSADKASEQFLIAELTKFMPEAGIIAEESGLQREHQEYCWVIDPLDGTTNFVRGLPYFCISVALTHRGKPILGAIYQPVTDEFFYAYAGHGAYLNGKKITVSKPESFGKSVILLGLPYTKDEHFKALLQELEIIAPQAFAMRHLGAAALDLAYVAAGRLDGVFFTHLKWWDVAAGIVLVTEAGGKVTDFQGKELAQDYVSCIAAGDLVYKKLQSILK
jgi:myo-inositol-1(or 4)-monophosphatase